MKDEDDEDNGKPKDKVLRPNFSPSSIRSQLQKGNEPPAKAESGQAEILTLDPALPDKLDPLPRPGDAYKVHGRHGNKPDVTIHFVTKDYSYEGFSYADLGRLRLVAKETPGTAPVLILRFNDTEVTLEGRHLPSLYNWIGLHRVPWIWEHPSPAQFTDENAMVISRITFRQVEG